MNQSVGEFHTHQLQIETQGCSETSCTLKIDSNLLQSELILDGTSILCDQQPHFGIITKSKLHINFSKKFQPIFQDINDQQEIEFMMISETNFEKLERLQKIDIDAIEQVYEDVDGFESLRKIFTIVKWPLVLNKDHFKTKNLGMKPFSRIFVKI